VKTTHQLNLSNELVEDAENLSDGKIVQLLRETLDATMLETETQKNCLLHTLITMCHA